MPFTGANKDIAPYKGKRRKLLDHLVNVDNADQDITEICQQIGLSRATYYKYIHEPEFKDALKLCIIDIYSRHLPQVASSMVKAAKRGDVRAGTLIHEVLSVMPPHAPTTTVNIAQIEAKQQFSNPQDALAAIEQARIELDRQEAIIRGQARIVDATVIDAQANNESCSIADSMPTNAGADPMPYTPTDAPTPASDVDTKPE